MPVRFHPLQIAVVLSAAACGGPAKPSDAARAAVVVPSAPPAAHATPAAATKKVLATRLSAGDNYTCAVLRTGAVKCWGDGDELGLGDHENRGDDPNEMGDALPAVDLGKGRTAISVSAGAEHRCAVLDTGAVKCWGSGADGRLGLGDTKARGAAPNEMGDALPAVDLGTGRTALAVSAGFSHTCALLDTGAVKCWGKGDSGRLGIGDDNTRGDNPKEMGDALPAVDLGTGRTAVAVSAGGFHTCAVLDTGAVKCWGDGLSGQLGLGVTEIRGNDPSAMGDGLPAVDLGTGRTAVALSAGTLHTCAVLDTGAIKCWGSGSSGELGVGDDKTRGDNPKEMGDALPAVDLGTGRTAVAVSARVRHTCAVLDTGAVKCWGDTPPVRYEASQGDAVPLGRGRTAVAVSAGVTHTCAVFDTGAVKCWGGGYSGALGLGNGADRDGELDKLPTVDLGGLVR